MQSKLTALSAGAAISAMAYKSADLASKGKVPVLFTVVALVIMGVFGLLACHDIDCVVSGGCITWSWVRTALYCIATAAQVVLILMAKSVEIEETKTKQ